MVVKTRSYSHSYDNRRWHSANQGVSWSNVGFNVENLLSSVTADYPKHDFRRLIARGENATTDMSGVQTGFRSRPLSGSIRDILKKVRLEPSPEGWAELSLTSWTLSGGKPNVISRSWVKGHIWRAGLTTPLADSALQTKVENQALLGFNRKVLKAQRDLQGLVTLGELGEALRMIRNPAKTLRSGIDDYFAILMKRGRSNRSYTPRAVTKIAADTWLEYSFGWRPLLSDIDSGAMALANALSLRPTRTPVSFTAYGQKTTASPIAGSNSLNGRVRTKYTGSSQSNYIGVKFYGAVGLAPNDDGFDQSRFGVSWSEIVPTVWELIPYSFLVDYFVNIGDIINSYASTFVDVLWMSKGTCQVSESSWNNVELIPEVNSNEQYVVDRWIPGSRCFKVSRTISRGKYTGTRIPRTEFTIPGMGLKWLNIAALGSSTEQAKRALFHWEKNPFFHRR